MDWQAKWIRPIREMGHVVPRFSKRFKLNKEIRTARLFVTAMGIYEAKMNGQRVSRYVLAPGWTSYQQRLQYQEYDVTELLQAENELCILVGKGWYRGIRNGEFMEEQSKLPAGLIAQLELTYSDGSRELIVSDSAWEVAESEIRFSEIYDGEVCDASIALPVIGRVEEFDGPTDTLIPQEGEEILEHEVFSAIQIFVTPKGETVVDFGQEITGYVELTVDAHAGDTVRLSHAEVLDKHGNFYNANYRKAKANYVYRCKDGRQTYHPRLTFYGFRYIRVDEFPGGVKNVRPENFKAIAVYSDIRQIGYIQSSNSLLNQFFSNVIWSQKSNFLDVPTDCPQRDERLGWTGDAQGFVRAAALNFDVERFFDKWLSDMRVEQHEDGLIPHIIPDLWKDDAVSSGWGDAATICPWELYLAYGDLEILKKQFVCMKKYVDYITSHTEVPYLWIGGFHFGDWLGLDAPRGSYEGSSRKEVIATAYYAYSTSLVIKSGKALGEDVAEYETLYQNILRTFQKTYPVYYTQTEYALVIHFRLSEDCQSLSNQLALLVKRDGMKLQTGFLGTPYLLHALSDFGHADIAYSLLLRTEYPSWLYPVTKGATTTWEHWDGIMENGDLWSENMNSFNHYLYGAVIDWVYTVAAGIQTVEEYPGYAKVKIAPIPDERLDWLTASFDSRHGMIRSAWKKDGGRWRYEITTPVEAEIVIGEAVHLVQPGEYQFYS